MAANLGLLLALAWYFVAPLWAQQSTTDAAHIDTASRAASVSTTTATTAPQAKPELIVLFKLEEDPKKRLALLQQLSLPAARSQATMLLLTHVITDDLSDKVRAAAAKQLLTYDGDDPVRALEGALSSEQGDGVRLADCRALAASANPAASEALEQLLTQDASAVVRLCAVQGLEMRDDRDALPAINGAAARDQDPAVRKAAKKAFAVLFAPPKRKPAPKAKPKPLETVDETGHLHCGADAGVCQCTNGVITPRAHCMLFEDCRHLYETTYQNEGSFECTWDGQDVEQQR